MTLRMRSAFLHTHRCMPSPLPDVSVIVIHHPTRSLSLTAHQPHPPHPQPTLDLSRILMLSLAHILIILIRRSGRTRKCVVHISNRCWPQPRPRSNCPTCNASFYRIMRLKLNRCHCHCQQSQRRHSKRRPRTDITILIPAPPR